MSRARAIRKERIFALSLGEDLGCFDLCGVVFLASDEDERGGFWK
jgi:hypothetical protein